MLDFFMPLDRELIVHHAFCQLNEGGLESLTLRRLAHRLGVQAPALYWHFKSKQALLDEMATQLLRETIQGRPRPEDATSWRDWTFALAQELRRVLLRYRDGARIFGGTYLTDASLYASMDASLRLLVNAGFSLQSAVVAMATLSGYTVGFVIEEQSVHLPPEEPTQLAREKPRKRPSLDPRYTLAARGERIDKEAYPLAYAAGAKLFGDPDSGFLAGLELIVNGMSAWLQQNAAV